jgi:uncharacterized membrane protein
MKKFQIFLIALLMTGSASAVEITVNSFYNERPVSSEICIEGSQLSERCGFSETVVFNVEADRYTFSATSSEYGSIERDLFIGSSQKVDLNIDEGTPKDDETGDEGLDAELEIRPYRSERGERITFDASDSTSNTEIERYRFDYDDDGSFEKTNFDDGIERKRFYDEYSGYAEVKVIDEDGDSEKARDYYIVDERDEQERGSMRISVQDEDGDLRNARVETENGPDFGSDGTDFTGDAFLENLETGFYDLKITCAGEEGYIYDVHVREGETRESFDFGINLPQDCKDEDFEDEDGEPEAEFDYSPRNPEEDESISFDGGLSTGDIVDYQWSFGDGDGSAGRQVTHRYDEFGTYPVRLTVEEDDGDQDTAIQYVSVGRDRNACGVTEESFYFSLDDYTIEEGESTQAELQVYNTGTENQEVEVSIQVSNEVIRDRTVKVPAKGSRTVAETIRPERDSFVSAVVSTSGGPCGFKDFKDMTKELIVLGESERDASLDVNVDSEDGYVRNARVEVEGPENRVRYTDRYGDAGFSLEPGRYDVEVSHPRYDSEEDSIRLRSGDNEELRFDLDRDESGDGTLEINVRDEDRDNVEDARVRVENGDRETEYTDSRGEARFSLEPDDYDVEVTHPDYEYTAKTSVEIEEDETTSRTLTLFDDRDRRGIEIVNTDYPSSICRGDTLSVDYRVRNNENYDESAQTTASGLGGIIVTNRYVIDSGDSVSGTLRFTNVEGSGREEFSIRVRNGTSDRVTRAVDVRDCETSQQPQEDDATSISMKLDYPISPNRAKVGDTVRVSGFVDGVNRRAEVTIDVDGNRKARVSTQPDGYYQTYIRMDSPGMKTVRARSSGESVSREIEVLPTATVSSVTGPRSVFEGETFEVCGQIDSQVQAGVFFYEDGRLIERTNTRGETCFEVEASDPGRHTYQIRAATPGTSSSSTVSVEVMETDVQAKSFPDQIASVESGSGMVKVDLYNSNSEQTRYNLDLEGLPSTWTSQSSKQVILSPGESREVFFYLTPREEGDYDPEVVVEADGSEVYRQKVDLETGGQREPRRKSFVEMLRNFLL